MIDTNQCPECGGVGTQRQNLDVHSDQVVEIRTCDDCVTQYEVHYGDPYKKTTYTEYEEDEEEDDGEG